MTLFSFHVPYMHSPLYEQQFHHRNFSLVAFQSCVLSRTSVKIDERNWWSRLATQVVLISSIWQKNDALRFLFGHYYDWKIVTLRVHLFIIVLLHQLFLLINVEAVTVVDGNINFEYWIELYQCHQFSDTRKNWFSQWITLSNKIMLAFKLHFFPNSKLWQFAKNIYQRNQFTQERKEGKTEKSIRAKEKKNPRHTKESRRSRWKEKVLERFTSRIARFNRGRRCNELVVVP